MAAACRAAGLSTWATPLHTLPTQPWPLGQRRLQRGSAVRAGFRSTLVCASSAQKGFHQDRLSAAHCPTPLAQSPLQLVVRVAERDDELEAVSWLRARSFYAYPADREFAGKIHQAMIAEEEFKLLKEQRLQRKLAEGAAEPPAERSSCLIALCPLDTLAPDGPTPHDERLQITDDGDSWKAVVGTLDLHAVRALSGEVLIGACSNAAYLANVCSSAAARRRGVGAALLQSARELARSWEVEAMYVHTMAVNEIALGFYERSGFVVEREESSNQAHYRGRCLDGVEGLGRTVLLRDTRLRV